MYVSEKHKFVYFGNCKSGSSSIIIAICEFYKAQGVPASNVPIPEPNPWPIGAHHAIFLPEKYKDYFKFTTVRNPYNREISKFNFLPSRQKGLYNFIGEMTFEEYLDWVIEKEITGNWRYDFWKRSQKEIIFDQPVLDGCVPVEIDSYIKCENLKEGFLSLPFVDQSNPVIEAKNNVALSNRVERFPESMKERLYEHFKQDFEMFGYDKEVPDYDYREPCGGYHSYGYNTNSTLAQEAIEDFMPKEIPLL